MQQFFILNEGFAKFVDPAAVAAKKYWYDCCATCEPDVDPMVTNGWLVNTDISMSVEDGAFDPNNCYPL